MVAERTSSAGADDEHAESSLDFFCADPSFPILPRCCMVEKGAPYCHVDNIDSLFTREEAARVANAAAAGRRGTVCLAWEFEMDLRLECNTLEKETQSIAHQAHE